MRFSHPTWGVQLKKMGHNLGYWDDMGMGQEPLCSSFSSWGSHQLMDLYRLYPNQIIAHDCELVLLETEDCS